MPSTNPLPILLCVHLLLCSSGFAQRGKGSDSDSSLPKSENDTIAVELLKLETAGEDNKAAMKKLDELLTSAVAKFKGVNPQESEEDKASRFFREVDATLIENNCIFPPGALINLLRNSLKPRTLSKSQYQLATIQPANHRRLKQMKLNFASKGTFYFMDCDLSAIIYKAAGEKLGLPIEFIEVPKHNFVRWSSPTLKLNWDTNDGKVYTDDEYAARWGVTEPGKKLLGWLQDMPKPAIRNYWLRMIGNWHERHERHSLALKAFESAASESPDNLASLNELAWLLATCKDAAIRNGARAVTVATKVVDRAPRANWIDTLAAAYAEAGDFGAAVTTEERARQVSENAEWGFDHAESLPDFDKCIGAYKKKLTYREAVTQGLIEEHQDDLPFD